MALEARVLGDVNASLVHLSGTETAISALHMSLR
jgi:hypothetical protein